jgi:predicted O-methyltransferase YrrM
MATAEEILERILAERPPLHPRADGSDRCIGLHSAALSHMYSQLASGNHTLETGCGLSTIVFALAGCVHQAVVPNRGHIEATVRFAEDYQVSMDQTTFVEARSEEILPGLEAPAHLDVVLIDGGHAFPIPVIDWFYTSQRLIVGGLLVIDDIQMKSISILVNYLSQQPEWENTRTIRRTAFFRKKSELEIDGAWDYWHKQPFNRSMSSRFGKLWAFLRYRT